MTVLLLAARVRARSSPRPFLSFIELAVPSSSPGMPDAKHADVEVQTCNERLLQLRTQHLLEPPPWPAPQQYTKSEKKRRALAPLVPVGNGAPSPSNVDSARPKKQRPSTAKLQTGPLWRATIAKLQTAQLQAVQLKAQIQAAQLDLAKLEGAQPWLSITCTSNYSDVTKMASNFYYKGGGREKTGGGEEFLCNVYFSTMRAATDKRSSPVERVDRVAKG